MVIVEEGAFPSFAKEGWTRPKENAAKHPLIGADGRAKRASPVGRSHKEIVVSSYRLFIPTGFHNRCLETTISLWLRPIGLARYAPPSAPLRNGAIFLMAQPPLLREGGDCACPAVRGGAERASPVG